MSAFRYFSGYFVLLIAGVLYVSAQNPPDPFPSPSRIQTPQSRSMDEMLARQRLAKSRKDHAEMLKRGEEAHGLAVRLEETFEARQSLTNEDLKTLDQLEKLVGRIRRDLGGDSDGGSVLDDDSDEDQLSSVGASISFLRESTSKLLDELKKTSRFTISAVAIQSTNAVIRIARFLRLGK